MLPKPAFSHASRASPQPLPSRSQPCYRTAITLRDVFSSNPRRNPIGAALTFVAAVYLIVLAAPSFLFAESLHTGPITLYTHISAPGLSADLARAQARLALSSSDDPNLPQSFFLTESHAEFAFFSAGHAHAFAITLPRPANSFLAPSDPAADTIHSDRPTLNQRPLSAVLGHHFGSLRILINAHLEAGRLL